MRRYTALALMFIGLTAMTGSANAGTDSKPPFTTHSEVWKAPISPRSEVWKAGPGSDVWRTAR